MKTHRFAESNGKASVRAHEPHWDDVYAAAFPSRFVAQELNYDAATQRKEVDRRVQLTDGEVLVEEKYDWYDTGNFFLEFWSVRERRTRGWIARDDLLCEWFVYDFVQLNTCYFMPWKPLRQAWHDVGPAWERLYKTQEVPNDGYTTVGLLVPIWQVLDALDGHGVFTVQRGARLWMRRTV